MEMDWLEWLTFSNSFGGERPMQTGTLILAALVGSLVSAFVIALFYKWFYGPRGTGSEIHRSFLILGPSITAIFIAVQFSLPLSLGLLGALSIVRFRTPIKEGEEIGFILLVVATSLSWAILNLQLLVILLVVSLIGLLVTSRLPAFRSAANGGMLVLTLPTGDYAEKGDELLGLLGKALPSGRIDSVSEQESESVISYSFGKLEPEKLSAVRKQIAGVVPAASAGVFFNRR
jgi:hypothetical protein